MVETAVRTLNSVKEELIAAMKAEVEKVGYWKISTCDYPGWCPLQHMAMKAIKRSPPAGLHVEGNLKFEVWDWTVTAL